MVGLAAAGMVAALGIVPAHAVGSVGSIAGVGGTRATSTAGGVCQVPTPASWTRAIKAGSLPGVPGWHTLTGAISADGHTRFAVLGGSSSQRLVELQGTSTAYKEIASFPTGWTSGDGFAQLQFKGSSMAEWEVNAAALPPLPTCPVHPA
jgi:hypothetical protein